MSSQWKTCEEFPELGEYVLIMNKKTGAVGTATITKDSDGNISFSQTLFFLDVDMWCKIPQDIAEFPKSIRLEVEREREEWERHRQELREILEKKRNDQARAVAEKLLASGMDAKTVKDVINRL